MAVIPATTAWPNCKGVHRAQQALRQPRATFWPDLALINSPGYPGRTEEAREAIRGLLPKKPGYTCAQYGVDDFMAVREAHEVFLEGLRRAGLAES